MRISDWSSDVCSSDLAAATTRVGRPTAALSPSVSLGGSVGTPSLSLEGLVDSSAFRFSVGPLISWCFPNRNVARARIAQSDATARAALARFDGSVLSALREAETALGTYARDLEENAKLKVGLDESRTAAALQSRMTRGGLTSSLALLDAERSLASAEAAMAVSHATIAADRVRLFLALGVGWETPTAGPDGGS